MSLKISFSVWLAILSSVNSQQSSYSPLLNEIENFDPADLKQMMEMGSGDASLYFYRLTFDYGLRLSEAAPYREALRQELFKHPQLEEYFVKLLKETPRHYDTAQEIGWIWGPLTLMRYSWAVRLLGEEVMDDTLMTQPGFTDEELDLKYINKEWTYGTDSFQRESIFALAHLHLPHAPFDETSPKIYKIRTDVIDEWKRWYVEHGEKVIAQLETEENERAELEAQVIAAAQSKAERYQNHPRNPPAPPSTPSEPKEPTSPTSKKAMVIALTLLAISLLVFLLVRLKSRNSQKS